MRVLKLVSLILLLTNGFAATLRQSSRSPVVRPDILYLRAKEGGFRMFEGEGKVEITSLGTVLVTGLRGRVMKSDDIRLQYKDPLRQVYFGRGRLVVQGKFRALQWAGKDLRATWQGKGRMRFVGEYHERDRKGEYWYSSFPHRMPWRTMHSYDIKLPRSVSSKSR
jgi:hypothetical protein